MTLSNPFFSLLAPLALCLASLGACSPSPGASSRTGTSAESEFSCTVSNECPLGELCLGGACTPLSDPECHLEGCLNLVNQCLTAPLGCECHIQNAGHSLNMEGTPGLHLRSSERQRVRAQIALKGGEVLASSDFEIEVENPDLFTVRGDTLIAGPHPGESQLRVNFGHLASCTATAFNHGPPPPSGTTEILIYDPASGQPIPVTTVVVERAGVAGEPPARETHVATAAGTVLIPAGESPATSVTLFNRDYDYLTLMHFSDIATPTMRVPLSRRGTTTTVGAARGELGFEPHLQTLGRDAGSIRLGVVSTSFPLQQLEHFGPGLFLGGSIIGQNCDLTPHGPGCYDLSVPGVLKQHVALWGGLVVSLPTAPLKPHFDVMGSPGRRFVWSFGGTFEAEHGASVFQSLSQRPEGSCPTCPTPTDASIMRSFQRLIGSASLGYQSNVVLERAPLQAWMHTLENTGPDDPRFPELQNAEGGPSLNLDQPMDRFSELQVPTLPSDPLSPTGSHLPGFLAVTGVQTLGSGFLPLGFGIGFDCTGDCSRLEDKDGVINPEPVCQNDDRLACEGRTNTSTPRGTLGMFHRSPPENLAGRPQKTFLLALPLNSIGAVDFRVRGVVLDGPLEEGTLSLKQLPFAEAAPAPAPLLERRYPLTATSRTDVHHVTFNPTEPGPTNAPLPRWHVYSPNLTATFEAPPVPASLMDPLLNPATLRRTHATVALAQNGSLSELLASPEGGLHRLLDAAEGFSSVSIPPQAP